MPGHATPVTPAAVRRDGSPAAVDENNGAMTQRGQVTDGLGDAIVVCRPDNVHRGSRYPAADHHYRKLPSERVQTPGRIIGSDQDERLAAEVEQDLGRLPLVPGGRHRAQQKVIAAPGGSRVQLGGEFGVEAVAYVQQHAQVTA